MRFFAENHKILRKIFFHTPFFSATVCFFLRGTYNGRFLYTLLSAFSRGSERIFLGGGVDVGIFSARIDAEGRIRLKISQFLGLRPPIKEGF